MTQPLGSRSTFVHQSHLLMVAGTYDWHCLVPYLLMPHPRITLGQWKLFCARTNTPLIGCETTDIVSANPKMCLFKYWHCCCVLVTVGFWTVTRPSSPTAYQIRSVDHTPQSICSTVKSIQRNLQCKTCGTTPLWLQTSWTCTTDDRRRAAGLSQQQHNIT